MSLFGNGEFAPIIGDVFADVKKQRIPTPELEEPSIDQNESFYATNSDALVRNWYSQRPYAFVFQDQKGKKQTFYLPLAPSNITINTQWATNVITTMYGTVEEHSEQRYYDITIAGTTGMMPRYYRNVEDQKIEKNQPNKIGRAGFAVKTSIGRAADGFFRRTLAVVENAIDQASELFGGKDKPSTGVDLKKSGYVAFHNFYKFLLAYKKDTASAGIRVTEKGKSAHPLRFVNYKDNNQYDVSVQQFQLTRDASEPFLYNYSIVLRAYNLRSADTQESALDIQDRKAELGLDGIETSLLAVFSNKAAQAKRAAYSAVAAGRGFGS